MTVPTPYKGNESYIFVSYAHKDAAAVWEIVKKMQASGFRVWFDRASTPARSGMSTSPAWCRAAAISSRFSLPIISPPPTVRMN